LLLEWGADPEAADALYWAVDGCEVLPTSLVQLLLARGVDPNSVAPECESDWSVLQRAVCRCDDELVLLLLASGADPRLVRNGYEAPVALARRCRASPGVIEALVGAAIDQPTRQPTSAAEGPI
jgi:hypothetical protein